jgi:hypothetical protein
MPPKTPNTRGIRAPKTPLPRLRLNPIRPVESLALDNQIVKLRGEPDLVDTALAPYIPWETLWRRLDKEHEPGQHISFVGRTRSGKTEVARRLILVRDFVVVFATKARDDSLYKPLLRQGFVMVDKWDPWDWERTGERRVIFRPLREGDRPTPQVLADVRDKFGQALLDLFVSGHWLVYFDEIRFLTENLKLQTEIDLLYLQGASNKLTIAAGTQRPVSVPINMFEQAVWQFMWRISDKADRDRAAEYAGDLAPIVRVVTKTLPRYEFMGFDKNTDRAFRSKLIL